MLMQVDLFPESRMIDVENLVYSVKRGSPRARESFEGSFEPPATGGDVVEFFGGFKSSSETQHAQESCLLIR